MTPTEWGEIKCLINDYWPKADWSHAVSELWHETFGNRNPRWMTEALKLTRTRFTSDVPQIKWVEAAYKEVAQQNSSRRESEFDWSSPSVLRNRWCKQWPQHAQRWRDATDEQILAIEAHQIYLDAHEFYGPGHSVTLYRQHEYEQCLEAAGRQQTQET